MHVTYFALVNAYYSFLTYIEIIIKGSNQPNVYYNLLFEQKEDSPTLVCFTEDRLSCSEVEKRTKSINKSI
jgi:hypothetical protein